MDHVRQLQLVPGGAFVGVPHDGVGHEGQPVTGLKHLLGPFGSSAIRVARNGYCRQTPTRMQEHTLSNAHARCCSVGVKAPSCSLVSGPTVRPDACAPIQLPR